MNTIRKTELREILKMLREIKASLEFIPEEFPMADVAELLGISRQAVYAKLMSGDFEPGVEFKYKRGKIYITRSAVSKLKRLRK